MLYTQGVVSLVAVVVSNSNFSTILFLHSIDFCFLDVLNYAAVALNKLRIIFFSKIKLSIRILALKCSQSGAVKEC